MEFGEHLHPLIVSGDHPVSLQSGTDAGPTNHCRADNLEARSVVGVHQRRSSWELVGPWAGKEQQDSAWSEGCERGLQCRCEIALVEGLRLAKHDDVECCWSGKRSTRSAPQRHPGVSRLCEAEAGLVWVAAGDGIPRLKGLQEPAVLAGGDQKGGAIENPDRRQERVDGVSLGWMVDHRRHCRCKICALTEGSSLPGSLCGALSHSPSFWLLVVCVDM